MTTQSQLISIYIKIIWRKGNRVLEFAGLLLEFLTSEYMTTKLSLNVGKELPLHVSLEGRWYLLLRSVIVKYTTHYLCCVFQRWRQCKLTPELFQYLYRASCIVSYCRQQMHNYFTNYHTPTCFDTIVSSSGRLYSIPCQVTQVFQMHLLLFRTVTNKCTII